jgi:hypothetical protein
MTLVTSPPRIARRSPSALVVADECTCTAALEALQRAVDVTGARVVVAALPRRDHPVCVFAPMSGMVTPAELRDEAAWRAHDAVRQGVATMPAASVTYAVVRSWAQVTHAIAAGAHDVVVLGHMPRRSHLRRLVVVAGAAGTALLIAGP